MTCIFALMLSLLTWIRITKHYPILMGIRRKTRIKTRGSWTPASSAKAHAAKARKRMESGPHDGPRRVPAGELLGVLQWHAADGKVRRWTIRQGRRMNGIAVAAQGWVVECGWDRLLRVLRKRLAVPKRSWETGVSQHNLGEVAA
jgi:hypothetical protein